MPLNYTNRICQTFIAWVILTVLAASNVSAAIVMTMRETAGEVVFSYRGTINIDGLTFDPGIGASAQITPNRPFIYFAGQNGVAERYLNSFENSPTFGIGDRSQATMHTGDSFGILETSLLVPLDYNSGDTIAGSMTFASTDFATLGIDTASGPYVWTLNNAASNTITLTAIPEPSGVAILGLIGIGLAIRRRRRIGRYLQELKAGTLGKTS
jgi:hypothetical protein